MTVDVEVFRAAVRAALDKAASGIEQSTRVKWDPSYRAGWVDALRAVRDDLTFTDPDPLYVPEPGTDDEPWPVLERVPGFNERIAEGRRQLKAGERVEFAPADRHSWALAVLIAALVVVAIVWRR